MNKKQKKINDLSRLKDIVDVDKLDKVKLKQEDILNESGSEPIEISKRILKQLPNKN